MSSTIWSHAEIEGDSLTLSDTFKNYKVQDFMKQFILTDEKIDALKRLFDKEIDEGLQTDETSSPADISRMAMGITYFTELFDGTENGTAVVINLTAQNLVLVVADVKPGFSVKTVRKIFTIDETVRKSPYIKIFEYLCDCLLIFFTENNLLGSTQNLGFCTDLPMIQFDIDKAIINYFTTAASEFPLNFYDIKKCFETVLLQERYKDIKFILTAILTKNMSLFVYSSYIYGPIDIFLNFEDDCDMIYKENLNRVPKWKFNSKNKHVYIDTELRNFGKSGSLNFIATKLDWLEKFLSQSCILELIRHTLIALHHELVYCRKKGNIGYLYKVNGISLSDVLNFMNTEDLKHALQLLPGGTIGISEEDALIAKYVCNTVFKRAALLISICLSHIFLRFRVDDFVIAVKCPLLEKLLNFETYVRKFIEVLAPQKKFQIFIVKNNTSMEGAALATSLVNRQRQKKEKLTYNK